MDDNIARPPFRLQQLDKTGDQERFLVKVQSSSGANGLPYDEFILSISDTRLAVWKGASGIDPKQVAEQLAMMLIELHGNAGKFSDDYFFSSDNTESADTVAEVVNQMQKERNLGKFIDKRDVTQGKKE